MISKILKASIVSTLTFGVLAQAQTLPELQNYSADEMTKQSSEETNAALFFLYLAENNLAGKSTGICVDYYPHNSVNPNSRFKLAFNTSAFVTGKSELLNEQKIKVENVARALNELSKISNYPLKAKVTGYADAQHYANSKSVDESIKKNQDLAFARANVIDELLKANASSCTFGSTSGVASVLTEKRVYPKGLNWEQYRKVVLDIDLSPPQVSTVNGTPVYEVANERLSATLARTLVEDELQSLLKPSRREKKSDPAADEIVSAREELEKFNFRGTLSETNEIKIGKQVSIIYDRLAEKGSIVDECLNDAYLALLTKIGIMNVSEAVKNGIKPGEKYGKDDPKPATPAQLYHIMRTYTVDQNPYLDKVLPTYTERNSGKPSDIFWCFKQGSKFFDQFFKEVDYKNGTQVKAKTKFLKSGEQILKETGLNEKKPEFVQVVFNPENLDVQTTQAAFNDETTAMNKESLVPTEHHHAFTCSACKNGVSFNKDNREFHAVYDSRLFPQVKAANGSIPALELSTNGLRKISKSALSYGALAASQTYIFLQCGGCDCVNSPELLYQKLGKLDHTLVINPFGQENARAVQEIKYADLKNACVYNAPILSACMVSPAQAQFERTQEAEKLFEYPDAKGGRYKASSIIEIAQKIKDNGVLPGAASLEQMQEAVRSVSCAENHLNLPSGNEIKDYQGAR